MVGDVIYLGNAAAMWPMRGLLSCGGSASSRVKLRLWILRLDSRFSMQSLLPDDDLRHRSRRVEGGREAAVDGSL